MLLARYIGRGVVASFLGVLAAALIVVLGIEFADHAHQYTGENWASAAALLYACKAAITGYQLAPATLLIAVELAVASFKRRGEVTAMRALGISPALIVIPCLVVGCAVAGAMFVADETVVGTAGRKADDITVHRFFVWGDWSTWYGPRRWFRSGRTLYFLRDVDPDGSYRNASVFELTPDFRLKRRLDADLIRPDPDGRWHVRHGTLRTLEERGGSTVTTIAEGDIALDEPARAFAVHTGRPEQLKLGELRREIDERREVGLRDRPYIVALHTKFTHSLSAIPLAVIGAALSLRQRRRDVAAVAMVEGLGAVAVVWAGNVLVRAASVEGRLAPWVGPWMLLGVLAVVAIALTRRALSR